MIVNNELTVSYRIERSLVFFFAAFLLSFTPILPMPDESLDFLTYSYSANLYRCVTSWDGIYRRPRVSQKQNKDSDHPKPPQVLLCVESPLQNATPCRHYVERQFVEWNLVEVLSKFRLMITKAKKHINHIVDPETKCWVKTKNIESEISYKCKNCHKCKRNIRLI